MSETLLDAHKVFLSDCYLVTKRYFKGNFVNQISVQTIHGQLKEQITYCKS